MSHPDFRPLTLGNTADDDPAVLDSLVQSEAEPPTPQVEAISTPALPTPVSATRLLTVRQSVDPTWTTPTLLLPEDTRRKYLYVTVTSPAATATDGVLIRSDSGTGTAVLTHGRSLPLDCHTGAVYALATGAAAVYVDLWSVTA